MFISMQNSFPWISFSFKFHSCSYVILNRFFVLLLGSFTYYKVIRWPGLQYDEVVDETAKLLKDKEEK